MSFGPKGMPGPCVNEHRHPGHRLDAARDDHVVVPGDDTSGREVHGLLRRAALPVDRHADDVFRPPGGEGGVAADVRGLLAGLRHGAPDDVLDQRRVDA
jgi:hypothetical protein